MSKWNILKSTEDTLVEKILDNFHSLGINKETCEELFTYAMHDNYSTDSSFFLSNILFKGGIEVVKEYLIKEIEKFDYQSEREMLFFGVTNEKLQNAINLYNTAKRLYNDIFK